VAPAPPTRSWHTDGTFRYVGGDPSLDLVNTVDWTRRGLEEDRLPDYGSLVRWAEGAGVIPAQEGSRLRRAAAARPADAERVLRAARRERWVLARMFGAVTDGRTDAAPWPEFNGLLTAALRRLQAAPARGPAPAHWVWEGQADDLGWLLLPVVRSAANLLTGSEAEKIRKCAGEDCGWMYVDRSRNGLRRWCEMATCGTREKTRRRRRQAR
jgi:predicted RNA-binding Zn ribbon-like protein